MGSCKKVRFTLPLQMLPMSTEHDRQVLPLKSKSQCETLRQLLIALLVRADYSPRELISQWSIKV